jgi:hypothetical protein
MNPQTIHELLSNRFQQIDYLFACLRKKKTKIKEKSYIEIERAIHNIRNDYELSSIRYLSEYGRADPATRAKISAEFQTYLVQSNVDKSITREIDELKAILSGTKLIDSQKINQLLTTCDKQTVDIKTPRIEFDICLVCNTKKEMFPHASELRCQICADIDVLKGTEFEENAVQDPNKQKKTDYDPSRFADLWIDKILAIGEVNFMDKKTGREDALLIVYAEAKKDGLKSEHEITCKYIRQVWKLHKYTDFNDYAAYARLRITGVKPRQLKPADRRMIKIIIIRVMRIFDEIKEPDRSNSLYYAYVLYKVIKQFFAGKPEISLLESIHIQKDATLEYNDNQYKKICEKHNENYTPKLEYEPTVPEEILY